MLAMLVVLVYMGDCLLMAMGLMEPLVMTGSSVKGLTLTILASAGMYLSPRARKKSGDSIAGDDFDTRESNTESRNKH
jgi:hypothetical protein